MFDVKLGLTEPRPNPHLLQLDDYLYRSDLPPLPAQTTYRAAVKVPWGMYANDRLSDCAIAGPAHHIMTWTANAGNIYVPTDAQVEADYSAVTGYDPADPRTDRGTDMDAMFGFWRTRGICGHKIEMYAGARQGDHAQAMHAINLFDGLGIGLALPSAVRGLTGWGDPPASLTGAWQPASWGYHYVPAVDFNRDGIIVVTWGQLLMMTWRFYDAFATTLRVPFSLDWLNGRRQAPNGFDLAGLIANWEAITGQRAPIVAPPAPVVPPPPAPGPPGPAPGPQRMQIITITGTDFRVVGA